MDAREESYLIRNLIGKFVPASAGGIASAQEYAHAQECAQQVIGLLMSIGVSGHAVVPNAHG